VKRVQSGSPILGAVITNAHRRRKITEQVRLEVSHLYPLLGTVRAERAALCHNGRGSSASWTTSKALDDYAQSVVEQLAAGAAHEHTQVRGIAGFADGILSAQAPRPPSRFPSQVAKPAPSARQRIGPAYRSQIVIAVRRGRPAGDCPAVPVPKEKVTVWITSNLIAEYRDWTWKAPRQLSHLIRACLSRYRESVGDSLAYSR